MSVYRPENSAIQKLSITVIINNACSFKRCNQGCLFGSTQQVDRRERVMHEKGYGCGDVLQFRKARKMTSIHQQTWTRENGNALGLYLWGSEWGRCINVMGERESVNIYIPYFGSEKECRYDYYIKHKWSSLSYLKYQSPSSRAAKAYMPASTCSLNAKVVNDSHHDMNLPLAVRPRGIPAQEILEAVTSTPPYFTNTFCSKCSVSSICK